MAASPVSTRAILYTGVAVFLLGQAFDTFWHLRNVSFVPEPPSTILVIHSGIYLGACVIAGAGLRYLGARGTRVAGSLLVVGALTQLTGFGLDTWAHAHDYAKDLYHNLLWYGFAAVVLGTVRLEAWSRGDRSETRDHNPERTPELSRRGS